MSSESSEDENIELMREAANNEFSNNLYNSTNGGEQNVQSVSAQKKSLRPQPDQKLNDMNIAPDVQKHLAKRLTDFIDSQLEEFEGSSGPAYQKRKIDGGIHLLSTSKNFVSSEPRNFDVKLKRYCHKSYPKRTECELSLEEKCREAAVSPDWILSQEATYGWAPNTKGKLEIFSASEVEIKTGSTTTASSGSEDKSKNTSRVSLEEKQEKKRLKRQRSRAKLKLIKHSKKMEGGEVS